MSASGQASTCSKNDDTISEIPEFSSRLSKDVSIFRVPNFLKEVNEKAYVPQFVSLGPYHYKIAELDRTCSHKKRAMDRMMKRLNNMDFSTLAREKILEVEKRIRDCYEERIECEGKRFADMLILDGCFILEILRTLSVEDDQQGGSDCYEPVFEKTKIDCAGLDILNDILKLENQIPWTVLQILLKLETNSTDVIELLPVKGTLWYKIYPFNDEELKSSWAQKVHDVLAGLWHRLIGSPRSLNQAVGVRERDGYTSLPSQDPQDIHHLLGLWHKWIVSSPESNQGEVYKSLSNQDQANREKGEERHNIHGWRNYIHRAVELRSAGIKFEPCNGGIKEIMFDRKSTTIYLPRITIKHSTEVLFRNLIAFEMYNPFVDKYVSGYVHLMDQLIDSEEDVALLRKKHIVTHRLGSDQEVAKLFNNLCKGVTVSSKDVFPGLTKKVHVHYDNKFKVQCAEFVHEHFSSPWKALAWVAGISILVLTLVQTIFSILSYRE